MPEPARIALRLIGLFLLVAGLVCAVLLVWPGPSGVAEALGVRCAHVRYGGPEQCSWLDAADLLWTGCSLAIVAGAVLRLVTRPAGRAPRTLDLRRWR